MYKAIFFTIILSLFIVIAAFAQRPPRPDGPPRGEGLPRHNWIGGLDTNQNGKLEADEFQSAIDRTFADLDRNGNGTIENTEVPHPPMGPHPPRGERPGFPGERPEAPPMPRGEHPDAQPGVPGERPEGTPPRGEMGPHHPDRTMLPPFFFMDRFRDGGSLNKAEFDKAAKEVFASMDQNNDGVLTADEARPPRHPGEGPEGPPPPPNARFIAAELRFGDRLVKDQPFSADIVIEDTRRLYDGSTVTKRIQGAIYRDAAGRTRREQPLEMVGGFSVVNGKNQAPMLVFINDFVTKSQYFLDLDNKVARRHPIRQDRAPRAEGDAPAGRSVSLGKKTIEGIEAEGTRITFEIPAGDIGNDKPIEVVTENWFSPELQMMIWSRHLDPLSGEHIFRLTNIKRSEPAADLFSVPAGFRIEN